MRLTLATLLLMASTPAWAGDLVVSDQPQAEPVSGAPLSPAVPAVAEKAPTATGASTVPYGAIYDAPLFGHAAAAPAKVDETALRFYAAGKNRARVDAEIKRLRGLHPAWKVPANLYATGAGNDEQPLWDLFAAGRTEELRFAIQAREKREAGWRPSADLLAKMARAETAAELKALSEAKDWSRVLDLAGAHPDTLSCGTVDLDWRVAEAFAELGSPERAYEVDAAILKSCHDRDERLATVRKAIDKLPSADIERLIASGDTLADGSGEFDDVRLDLARRQLGRAIAVALPAAGGTPADDVPAANLEALGAATLRTGEASDAALLGWYAFRHARWADADGWFKLGLQGSGGDSKMIEGHALALKELGRLAEAEQLAHAWRERSGVMRGLFVTLMAARLGGPDAAAIDPAEMADFTAILLADRSVEAAGALGWSAYGRQDFDAAGLWFGRAVDWAGKGDIPDKVVEGYGLTLKSLGRYDAAEDFLYARRDRSAAARDLYVAVAVSALSGSSPGMFGPDLPAAVIAPERMDRFAEVIRTARSASGGAAMGWREIRDNRPAAAVDWFRDAAAWSPDGVADIKMVEGLVVALKNSGQTVAAEDEAFARMRDSAQLREAYRGIVVTEITDPALAGRMSDDRIQRFADLVEAESSSQGAEALGWYRLNGDGCGYGADWFRRAVAWSPDHKGTAKGNEGYAQALQRAGHDLMADDVASAWADRAPDMKGLAIKVMVEALTRDLFPPRISEDRLGAFAALVRDEHSAAGAQAMAWYRYRDAGTGYGVAWFEDAIRWSPDHRADAKTVEGYASALRDIGRLNDAEEALFPFVDHVPLMRDLYIDTVVSELTLDNPPEPMPHDRLARFIAVATPLRSAAAAQALGWYRFARHEYPDAAIWFKEAVDWWPELPPDADRFTYVPEGYRPLLARLALRPEDYRRTPRAFTSRVHDAESSKHRYVETFGGLATTWTGYALALRAVGRTQEAEDIAFQWRDRWPMLGRFYVDLAIEALTRKDGPPIDPDRLKRYAAVIEEERDAGGAAALGWAAHERHDAAEAAVWLKAATDWRPTDAALDARGMVGYVDALRASGRAEEAFAAAAAWADQVPEMKAALLDVAREMLASAGDPSRTSGGATPEHLAEAVALAKADPSARSAAALGWYDLGIKQAAASLPLFKAAVVRAGEAAQAVPADTAPDGEAAALPKAVEGLARALRAVGRDADALTFVEAWSARVPAVAALSGDFVADAIGRDIGDAALAPGTMDRLAATAVRLRSVPAAAAFGWSAFRRHDWSKAAGWFADGIAWAPDRRPPVKVLEGYAASLHNQCRFGEAETAALSRPDDDADGRLRVIYVDSVADRISRGKTAAALAPADAARFATATLAISSANGAQALGWLAYRSRQFGPAAAWFEKALSWRATEAEAYGLALSYRRLGDAAALAGVLARYEGRFASLAAVRRAGVGGREPPMPDFGDLARRGCAGGETTDRTADTADRLDVPSPKPDAAVMLVMDPSTPAGPVQAPPRPDPERAPPAEAAPLFRRRPVIVASVETQAAPARPAPASEAPAPSPARPRVSPRAPLSGSAASALAAKDYAACLRILARRPVRTSADREVEGWCLLGLQRPAEAAEAFRVAGVAGTARVASDSALGETLSHLRDGDTAAAVDSAGRTALGDEKRRDLGVQILAQQAYDAYKAGRWAETLDLLRRRVGFAAEPRDLIMLRGWAQYHCGNYEVARRAFAAADAQLSDHDSRTAIAAVDTATTPKGYR